MSELKEVDQNLNNIDLEEKETTVSKRSQITLQIAGAAIFGALSIALSFLSPILPRVPQGIAFFDPVSIVWVACFLIYGPMSGILCCVIGFIGLIPFDVSIPVIGPLMKFCATIPLVVVPILLLRLYRQEKGVIRSQKLKKPRNYILCGAIAITVRVVVMVILNIVVYLSFFGSEGLEAWLVMIIIINPIQSIWDLLIPYLLVYGTKLDVKFKIW
jgi:riboflavin transporter FmnP